MSKKRNIKLTIQYDGTDFCGWQTQPGGNSIQDCLQAAASRILNSPVKIIGSGRTDAGVHARGQTANFITDSQLEVERIRRGLNAVLPPAVSIVTAVEVALDFHARHHARRRTYIYYLWNETYQSPFYNRFCWWVPRPLSIDAMAAGAALLVGRHDFAAFTPKTERETVRTISNFTVKPAPFFNGKMLAVIIGADAFLYHQVRLMTGTLVQIGLGKSDVERAAAVLKSRDVKLSGPMAPARGLFLERVEYWELV